MLSYLTFLLVNPQLEICSWIRKNHGILHIVLLALQLGAAFWIGWTANTIQNQNYSIQKALYDFEPQISGFVNGIIWVYEHKYQAVANIEVLINAPHSGNFTLQISKFYPFEQYLEPGRSQENHLNLQDKVRDAMFPQAYRYRGDVNLVAYVYLKHNLTETYFFAGVLEFEIVYYDVPRNKMHSKLFNGTVYFEFSE
jgi:hypothetical protein